MIVDNNSLAGDKAQNGGKLRSGITGENIASQLVNGLINADSEVGDLVTLSGGTAFDLTAALTACATGDSYCSQAKSDLAKKDAAAAATLTAIMNGDA